MARQHDIVQKIMKTGNCILILDGKEFGTLMGELLKMLSTAEDELIRTKQLLIEAAKELRYR